MNIVDYGAILAAKYPGRSFTVGDTYESLVSNDGGPLPTQEDLDAVWPEVLRDATNAAASDARHAAFIAEADPLFMKWQAGEATKQEWLAKREEIRQRYPYSEASALIGG
jgi:hypothetical protein